MKKVLFILSFTAFVMSSLISCKSQTACGKTKRWHKQNQKGMGDWMNRR